MKIIINTEKDEENKAKRLLSCDESFGLLRDIDQFCRTELKYEGKKPKEKALEEIREMINESNLLDLYQ